LSEPYYPTPEEAERLTAELDEHLRRACADNRTPEEKAAAVYAWIMSLPQRPPPKTYEDVIAMIMGNEKEEES
jgi:hypothetical protein